MASWQGGVGSIGSFVEAIEPAVDRSVVGSHFSAKRPEACCILCAERPEVGGVFFSHLFQPAGKGCHQSDRQGDTKGEHSSGCRNSGQNELGINRGERRRVVWRSHGELERRQSREHGPHFNAKPAAGAFCGSETYLAVLGRPGWRGRGEGGSGQRKTPGLLWRSGPGVLMVEVGVKDKTHLEPLSISNSTKDPIKSFRTRLNTIFIR